jgi:hypothetical protein
MKKCKNCIYRPFPDSGLCLKLSEIVDKDRETKDFDGFDLKYFDEVNENWNNSYIPEKWVQIYTPEWFGCVFHVKGRI